MQSNHNEYTVPLYHVALDRLIVLYHTFRNPVPCRHGDRRNRKENLSAVPGGGESFFYVRVLFQCYVH